MFNLYTYEKKLLEEAEKKSQELLKEKFKKKRKMELKNLTKNYDNRMKEFIFSMCEKPIKLHKSTNSDDENNKKLLFYEFKSDKKRLEEMEKYKEKLKLYEQERYNIEKKRNILKIKNHMDYILIQPKMKFTSKSQLENIIESIKKDDIYGSNIIDSSVLEHFKKIKFGGVKKIKEFYTLLDKEYLKDDEIKENIKLFNEIDKFEKANQYSIKNYIEWKYHHNIITHKEPTKHKKLNDNRNTITQMMGINNTKPKTKNKFEFLIKDDFKTHFKGASQYVEMLNHKDDKELESLRLKDSIREKLKREEFKKRALSSLRLNNKKVKINYSYSVENKKNQSLKANESARMIKRPSSVINISQKNKNKKDLFNKKSYSIKDLGEDYKKRKLLMDDLMNKEINNSLEKDFMRKYDSINMFNNSGMLKIPSNCIFQNRYKFSEIKSNENLKDKLAFLIAEINKQKRKINDEKYKIFVKKYSRSLFGFKKKKLGNKVNDNKIENKLEYVDIDGKPYSKKDIKTISGIIFKKCNFYNTKKEFKK